MANQVALYVFLYFLWYILYLKALPVNGYYVFCDIYVNCDGVSMYFKLSTFSFTSYSIVSFVTQLFLHCIFKCKFFYLRRFFTINILKTTFIYGIFCAQSFYRLLFFSSAKQRSVVLPLLSAAELCSANHRSEQSFYKLPCLKPEPNC